MNFLDDYGSSITSIIKNDNLSIRYIPDKTLKTNNHFPSDFFGNYEVYSLEVSGNTNDNNTYNNNTYTKLFITELQCENAIEVYLFMPDCSGLCNVNNMTRLPVDTNTGIATCNILRNLIGIPLQEYHRWYVVCVYPGNNNDINTDNNNKIISRYITAKIVSSSLENDIATLIRHEHLSIFNDSHIFDLSNIPELYVCTNLELYQNGKLIDYELILSIDSADNFAKNKSMYRILYNSKGNNQNVCKYNDFIKGNFLFSNSQIYKTQVGLKNLRPDIYPYLLLVILDNHNNQILSNSSIISNSSDGYSREYTGIFTVYNVYTSKCGLHTLQFTR